MALRIASVFRNILRRGASICSLLGIAGVLALSTHNVQAHDNPPVTLNFTCNICTNSIDVHPGNTTIYATCYGQKWNNSAFWIKTCSSPNAFAVEVSFYNATCNVHNGTDGKAKFKLQIHACNPPSK